MTESCDSTFINYEYTITVIFTPTDTMCMFLKYECIISFGVEQILSVKYLSEIIRPVNIFVLIRCKLIRIVKILTISSALFSLWLKVVLSISS